MSVGLNVTMLDTQDGTKQTFSFSRLPVRIGRNVLNDIRLGSGYVSQFHAVLDMAGDTILLWDLGSRNGTFLPSRGSAPPNAAVDLALTDYEFGIATTVFQISRVELAEEPKSRRRGGVREIVEESTRIETSVADLVSEEIEPLYSAYRLAWSQLHRNIQARIGPLSPELRFTVCQDLQSSFPALRGEADFRRLSTDSAGIRIDVDHESEGAMLAATPSSAHVSDPPRDEAVALAGLKQLAAWYMPGEPPPAGTDDVLGFLQNIQDTLDVFLKCFVPLRDGYKFFRAQMDIQRRRSGSSGAAERVTTARDPRELAMAMLNWRTATGAEPRVVEDTFADLMIHHAAMLNGIMRGVKSLLSELAPETIERTVDDPRKKSGGLQIGPFRYKQLWDQYVERHTDLSAEDREAFALIFGPQFAQAYAQFAEGAAGGPANTTTENPIFDVTNARFDRTIAPPPPSSPGGTGLGGTQGGPGPGGTPRR